MALARNLFVGLVFVQGWLAHAQVPAAAMGVSGCAKSCVCTGPDKHLAEIRASAILQCILRGQQVSLERVLIKGDLDLSDLPLTLLSGAKPARIPGMDRPREALELAQIEHELSVPIDGAIFVKAGIHIRSSELSGRLLGPTSKANARFVGPLVFLAPVQFTDTTFRGLVDLSRSIFRRPLRLDRSMFHDDLTLRYARFDANTFFQGVQVEARINLADARFQKEALFMGMGSGKVGSMDFSRARFARGAAFHRDESSNKTTLLRNAEFSDVEFIGKSAEFQKVTFEGAPTFSKMKAVAGARFDGASFNVGAGGIAFNEAVFGGAAIFDDAKFSAPVNFANASFAAGVPASFDRADFRKSVKFDQAIFSGPLTLVGTTVSQIISFVDAETRSTLDARHANFSTLTVGGRTSRARIGGDALFDYANVGRATFDNTAFIGRASFVGTRFGSLPCDPMSSIAVSFANALFQGAADFSETRLIGKINLPHVSAEPGRVRWRWAQLEERIVAEPEVQLTDRAGAICLTMLADHEVTPEVRWRRLAALTDAHRWIERNFNASDLSDDASEAVYAKKKTENELGMEDDRQPWVNRIPAFLGWGVWGTLGGYGVKPVRIAVEMLVVFFVFFLVYFFSKKPLDTDHEADAPIDWKAFAFPWRDSGSLLQLSRSRAAVAAWISLAALTPIRVRGAYIVLPRDDSMRWAVVGERVLGYLLLFVLGYSLLNTMPLLHKLLGWLPGF